MKGSRFPPRPPVIQMYRLYSPLPGFFRYANARVVSLHQGDFDATFLPPCNFFFRVLIDHGFQAGQAKAKAWNRQHRNGNAG